MGTSPEDFRKISQYADEGMKIRREKQAEGSKLRLAIREARDQGDRTEIRRLAKQAKRLRSQIEQEGTSKLSESQTLMKAKAAISRRGPKPEPSYPRSQIRASELPSPDRGNSFAREFGASDRETPNAGHSHATVPQALRLLNGMESALLTSRRNDFSRSLDQLSSTDTRLDFLFLSIYSTRPTVQERDAFLPEVATSTRATELARAMLTSNRFLFVQ